jgi:hypothetical protein
MERSDLSRLSRSRKEGRPTEEDEEVLIQGVTDIELDGSCQPI